MRQSKTKKAVTKPASIAPITRSRGGGKKMRRAKKAYRIGKKAYKVGKKVAKVGVKVAPYVAAAAKMAPLLL